MSALKYSKDEILREINSERYNETKISKKLLKKDAIWHEFLIKFCQIDAINSLIIGFLIMKISWKRRHFFIT